MLIAPRKTKYKKMQKGNLPNKILATKDNIVFGSFAIKSVDSGILTNQQIESVRKIIAKKIKKQGKLWIKIFTHLAKTQKPVEVRMGKGKGSVSSWIAKINAGRLLFEIEGIKIKLATEIFNTIKKKLSIKIALICQK